MTTTDPTSPAEPDLHTPLTTDYYTPSRVPITTTATTTGTGRGAVTDAHTGWHCPHGASLLAGITGPGRGTLPAHHGVIYVCPDHQTEAEARITAAGHQPDTDPAPPGHRWDPWPCGHITTHGGDPGHRLATTLTTPATTPLTTAEQNPPPALPDAITRALAGVLAEVAAERTRQDARWGEQNHRDGTGPELEVLPGWTAARLADAARNSCQRQAEMGIVTWKDIFGEEACEALAESDPARLRAELIQVAAVAVAWTEAIDRRAPAAAPDAPDPGPCSCDCPTTPDDDGQDR